MINRRQFIVGSAAISVLSGIAVLETFKVPLLTRNFGDMQIYPYILAKMPNLDSNRFSHAPPVGTIYNFLTTTDNPIWVLCDGRQLLCDEYPDLYKQIGHAYE